MYEIKKSAWGKTVCFGNHRILLDETATQEELKLLAETETGNDFVAFKKTEPEKPKK